MEYRKPSKIFHIAKTLDEELSAQVIHKTFLTDLFQIKTWLEQGCLFLRTLNLIAMN